jgi:hypothetical protein
MSFPYSLFRKNGPLAVFVFFLCFSLYSTVSFSTENPIVTAQGEGNSSGNEMLKAIVDGTDFKGMTKQQIVASYGEPGQKDTAGEKGRYDEKWTYSCETHNGLDYDCVFLYFMEDRVVDVENF